MSKWKAERYRNGEWHDEMRYCLGDNCKPLRFKTKDEAQAIVDFMVDEHKTITQRDYRVSWDFSRRTSK